ncbi:MAG: peptidylprolyl isomerase [Sphingobacteriaceae bacterium]|nr:peptidylprolyl isomerase [Cytophagaceae bacterium]
MAQAKSGDTVQVHYTGRLEDGSVFDSSDGRDPLEFQLGSGMVIPGFDQGLTGMTVGEKKTIHIPADEAYGPVNEEMILQIERAQIPPDLPLELGMQLNMHQDGNGQVVPVKVVEVTDESVTLDANHELAGKTLIFDLELVGVN